MMPFHEVRARVIDAIRYGGLGTIEAETLVDALIARVRQDCLDAAVRLEAAGRSPEWLSQALNEGNGTYKP
jgi:hypothetical protein